MALVKKTIELDQKAITRIKTALNAKSEIERVLPNPAFHYSIPAKVQTGSSTFQQFIKIVIIKNIVISIYYKIPRR